MEERPTYEDLKLRISALERELIITKGFEQKFENIFHESLDALMIVDRKSRNILSINETTGLILGFQERELQDKPFSILYPPMKALADRSSCYDFQAFGTVFSQDFLRSDGSTCLLDLTATLIDWNDAEVILVTLRDACERRQWEEALRDSEEKLRTITNAARDAVIMLDEEGAILYWNPAARTIFGYTDKEIIGRNLDSLIAAKKYHKAYL